MLLVLTVAFCGVTAEYHAQQCERSAADLYLGTRVVADENVASERRSSATDHRPSLKKR
jgi:hypothetical protein